VAGDEGRRANSYVPETLAHIRAAGYIDCMYCNAVLTGLRLRQLNKLHVINAAARLIIQSFIQLIIYLFQTTRSIDHKPTLKNKTNSAIAMQLFTSDKSPDLHLTNGIIVDWQKTSGT